MSYTAEEILDRMRAEFDWLWHFHNREQKPGEQPFNLGNYCAQLEGMIMNRFAEAHLQPYPRDYGGVAEWDRQHPRVSR